LRLLGYGTGNALRHKCRLPLPGFSLVEIRSDKGHSWLAAGLAVSQRQQVAPGAQVAEAETLDKIAIVGRPQHLEGNHVQQAVGRDVEMGNAIEGELAEELIVELASPTVNLRCVAAVRQRIAQVSAKSIDYPCRANV
jgi:hypothetical protein